MFLTCPDEVVRYVGATLQRALDDPVVGRYLVDHPVRMRFGIVDPDCVLFVDAERREVRVGTADDDAVTGMVAMAGDTAIRFCRGLVDVPAALRSGEIAAEGDVVGLLHLLADGSLSVICADVLRGQGRNDLLEHELAAVS